MSVIKRHAFLVVLTFLWTANGEEDKTCVVKESCVLLCDFQTGDDVVIHWIQSGNIHVHSFYHNRDQLVYQNEHFRGRTSLFQNQIQNGDASLLLTNVNVQDQGHYKCYTSTIAGNKDLFIKLKVEAPVHKISIEQVENRITCSSEGIYPKPEVTWSTSPPSTLTPQGETKIQESEQHLYSISSSLILSDSNRDLDYICTITDGSHQRKATLYKPTFINGSSTLTTIPCTPSNTPSNTPLTSLIWRFNHSEIILNGTDVSHRVSDEWKQPVKEVSRSGSLTLQDLSSRHEGIYTCELRNDVEAIVTDTLLKIEHQGQGSSHVAGIAGGVVAVAFIVVAVILVVIFKYKKKHQGNDAESDGNSGQIHPGRKQLATQKHDKTNGHTEKEMQPLTAVTS